MALERACSGATVRVKAGWAEDGALEVLHLPDRCACRPAIIIATALRT